MAIRNYYGAKGRLLAGIDAVGDVLTVDAELAGALSDFANGTDTTYLYLRSSAAYEIVRVLDVSGNLITVTRPEEGTTSAAFPLGTEVGFVLTTAAVIQSIQEQGLYPLPDIQGDGLVNVEATAGTVTVGVDPPQIVGINGVNVMGDWPEYTISYNAPSPCYNGFPYPGGGGGGLSDVYFDGIVSGNLWGDSLEIYVAEPSFSGVGGIQITGEWPYLTFTYTGGGAGGGVSQVYAGAGVTVTGDPTANPTVSVTNTGVTAGDYAGFIVNGRGQITQLPVGFAPISAIESGNLTLDRTGHTVTIDAPAAAVGQAGVLEIVDSTDDFNPTEDTMAITSAGVAKAMESLVLPDVAGSANYIGESDGDYTNILSGTATAIELLAGEKAIVYAECSAHNPIAPEQIINYGVAIFNAESARVQANQAIAQNMQHISFVVTGPMNTSLVLVTTALPGGIAINSYSLWIQRL